MGKYLNLFKTKISKAEAIYNPWGLARYLAMKHNPDQMPKEKIPVSQMTKKQKSIVGSFAAALEDTSTQNRRGKINRIEGTSATHGKQGKQNAHFKARARERNKRQGWGMRDAQGRPEVMPDKKEEKSLDVQKFLDFMSDGDIPALNKMLLKVDDSSEGLFMQAVRKAMGIHGEQYKDIGKPQFLKKATKSKPLQKLHPRLAAFLAGLAMSDQFVENPRGQMTAAQQREWERTLNRQMKRKSLKDGVSMDDLQKHWSDASDTYVRRIPVAKGVTADETFLNKKQPSPPRAGEVWNPVTHRWTKAGNIGQVNVGSGGKKRVRAGSTSAGAHSKNVGGLSGKGRVRHLAGEGGGRLHRGKTDVAEQAQGTKAGVGSAKGPTSVFRTGAKSSIKRPTSKTGSGSFKRTPTRKRTPKGLSGKHSNLNVRQVANTKRRKK